MHIMDAAITILMNNNKKTQSLLKAVGKASQTTGSVTTRGLCAYYLPQVSKVGTLECILHFVAMGHLEVFDAGGTVGQSVKLTQVGLDELARQQQQ